MERVLHTPITDLEELKFDMMSQLPSLEKGDKVIIVVDSIGQLASKKEVDDALAEKSTQDMTRAKVLKSVFRMVNPHLNMKDIPFIGIAHTGLIIIADYFHHEVFSKNLLPCCLLK